jgi:antitoxin component YwqK of YwqJK toxin-antitoxin module
MNKLFLYLVILFNLSLFGQSKNQIYYNSNWNLCPRAEAKYYRIYGSYDKNSKAWNLTTYYINGKIQWKGKVKNNDKKATNCRSAKCHEIAIWYYENGRKKIQRSYTNGILNGISVSYDKNGIINHKLNYTNGIVLNESSNHSTGVYTKKRNYSYSVSGYGNNNSVNGTVDVNRNGGSATVYDEEGNEIELDVEWSGKGKLEGYDQNGNYYDLEVD